MNEAAASGTTEQGTPGGLDAFIARWGTSAGAERANYQIFLAELCDVLGVPRPEPSVADEAANRYVFDKAVTFQNPDGKTSTGYIDLYRRGAFVCETKQSVAKPEKDPLSVADPAAPKARRKSGTSVRGTVGWDDSMIAARGQAEGYVRALADDNPPFLLVIDIGHSFELYADFSRLGKVYTAFPDARSHRFSLDDLRDEGLRERLKMLWLDPLALDPARHAAKVTREIAARIAVLARRLEAKDYEPEQVAWFLIRCLFTFFSEDVCLTPRGGFTSLLESMKESPEQFVPLVSEVWKTMGQGGFSTALRTRIKQFKGTIFREHDPLPLDADEIALLIDAGKSDWKDVEPAIFGTLLERALDPRERHKLGAHFTPRAYVERLVVPTIIEPVRDDWEAARAASLTEANAGRLDNAKAETRKFLDGLTAMKVLDPACGTGNFLYVSMVKLKEIEAEARDWLAQLGETQTDLEHMERTVDPQQFLGIEINPRAVAIAEVVLWIGWLQWHLRDRKSPDSFSEPILQAYGNIECRDALLEYDKKELVRDESGKPVTRWDGVTTKKHPVTGEDVPDDTARVSVERYVNPRKAEWPQADFVVGNPPFLGPGRMRAAFGDGYTDAVRDTYPEVPESSDYVMYWWHKAAELLSVRKLRRFGLITTNSIRQSFARRVIQAFMGDSPRRGSELVSLAFAIPDHPWVDSADGAAVRIAMTVGCRGKTVGQLSEVTAEEEAVDEHVPVTLVTRSGFLSADLRVGASASVAIELVANSGLANRGFCLFGSGFIVLLDRARELGLGRTVGLDRHIRPYRNGKDLTQSPRGVFVIDLFGLSEQQVQEQFPDCYQHVAMTVKPERAENKRESRRRLWWVFGEPNKQLRLMLQGLDRYIATSETAKYRVFQFLDRAIAPDNMLVAIASDDSFLLGLMSSRIHVVWALAAGGRLGVGNDPRYNKTACFDPFPFPAATDSQKQKIRELGEALDAHRKKQQAAHPGLTITGMYNVLEKLRSGEALTIKDKKIHDDGLVSVLKKIHDDLDAAVFDAYGWPATLTDDEILERLVALNHERAAEEKRGLIRWLRPEFQNSSRTKAGGGDVQQTLAEADIDDDDADDDTTEPGVEKPKRGRGAAKKSAGRVAKAPKASKQSWPKDLAEQTRAVRSALAAVGGIMTAADVAKQFKNAKSPRVEEILATLVALGHARRTDDGYASA
ncbi:MAG: DNA methyltransferase [Pirellulales bacterium]